jgi:hypothetical protein
MTQLAQELLSWWPAWIWFVPAIVGAFFSGVRDFILDCIYALRGAEPPEKSNKPVKPAARKPALAPPEPCRHEHAIAVRNELTGEREAWLCLDCDEQLPANWSVSREDLESD